MDTEGNMKIEAIKYLGQRSKLDIFFITREGVTSVSTLLYEGLTKQ